MFAYARRTYMSSLYKNNRTWYLSITHNGKRISRSIKTKDRRVAIALKPHIKKMIIDELLVLIKYFPSSSFIVI